MEQQQDANQATQPKGENEVKPGRDGGGNKKRKLLVVLIILVVISLLGGGAWFLLSTPPQSAEEILPGGGLDTPETNVRNSIPTPTATPTPIEIDKSEIRIQLLNGTGIPGEASLVQDELEELGYENIEVGNADDQDYEDTNVTFSGELPESFVDEFISELENVYTEVDSSTSSNLGDFDIRIVAGLRISYTPAPTKAPDPTATPTVEPTVTVTPTSTPSPTPTP